MGSGSSIGKAKRLLYLMMIFFGSIYGRIKGLALKRLKGVLLFIASFGALASGERFVHLANAERSKDILAGRFRSQGFVANKPQQATRDAKLSKRDYDVWVLKCENATYRI